MIYVFVRCGTRRVISLNWNYSGLWWFVSVHIGYGSTGRLTLRFMIGLVCRGGRVMLGKVLCIVPQLNSIPIIVILPLDLTLPLIDVIGRPFHLFLSLHDHISETYSFLFVPLVALRIVLSWIIERFIKFVVRWGRSLLFLLLVIDLRQVGRFGGAFASIDLAVDFVEVGSGVRDLISLTNAFKLRICRCITHVSYCYVRKFIFLSFCEAHTLLYFVVNRTSNLLSLPIQKNVGWGLMSVKDVRTSHPHSIVLKWCK